ncbi:MAG: hypothetical protein IT446_04220 [Phycisphaerales bacterium]|nr:hypothetical protein [Phycisphaerales bacterium]
MQPAQPHSEAQHDSAGSNPMVPPRPVNGPIRRRAWNEPRVRFWWASGLILLVIAMGFAIDMGAEWINWRGLILHGQKVTAEVVELGGVTRAAMMAPNTPVKLAFELDGQSHTVAGVLDGRTEFIRTHDRVPIYVDPADPSSWTALMEVPPLSRQLLAVWITLPLALVLLAVAVAMRGGLLRLWRDGQAESALVLQSQHSALAPLSRMVRCTPADESDTRVFSVFVPQRCGVPQRGQAIWIIRSGNRAMAAELFTARS